MKSSLPCYGKGQRCPDCPDCKSLFLRQPTNSAAQPGPRVQIYPDSSLNLFMGSLWWFFFSPVVSFALSISVYNLLLLLLLCRTVSDFLISKKVFTQLYAERMNDGKTSRNKQAKNGTDHTKMSVDELSTCGVIKLKVYQKKSHKINFRKRPEKTPEK